MLRPTRVFTEIRQRPATLVVLADRSKSMQTADAFGDRTRWDALRETISQSLPLLSNMGENVEVKVYAFDRELVPLEFAGGKLDLGKTADGKQTAIGAALEDVLKRESGKRLAGVILLSDGAQQAYAPRDMQPQNPGAAPQRSACAAVYRHVRPRSLGHPIARRGHDRSGRQSQRVHQKRTQRRRHRTHQRAW